jgi:hypothetical protein
MILGALCGLAAFGLFLAAQLVVLRMRPSGEWLAWNKRLAAGVLLIALLALGPLLRAGGDTTLTQGGRALGALWGALTFLGLYVLYMPFYYVVRASLSVRTLILLRGAGGSLPRAEVARDFTSERFVADRLDTMVTNGFLTRQDTGYAITAKGGALARAAVFVKALWRLGAGG